MAEITAKRLGELQRGILHVLHEASSGLPAKEVLSRLEAVVPPTEFENSEYPSTPGKRRYEKIVRFSTIGPVKAGWMVKEKGTWTITEEARRIYQTITDPLELNREERRLYREWKSETPAASRQDVEGVAGTPDTIEAEASATLEEAQEAAWAEIERYLSSMSPYDFQEVVAGLLRGLGYYVDWISPPGPDKGIDIVAHRDPLGVKGPRIKAQVKRRADKATVEGVRGFVAVLGDSDVGVFVNAGGFTRDAQNEARRQEKKRVMLLDLIGHVRPVDRALRSHHRGTKAAASVAPGVLFGTAELRDSRNMPETRRGVSP